MPATGQPAPPPQQEPRSDRTKAWLIAALFILTVVLAVLATLFFTTDDDDVADTTTTTTAAPSGGGGGGGGGQRTTTTTEAPDEPDNPAQRCLASGVVAAVGGELAGIPVRVVSMSCTLEGDGYARVVFEPDDGTVADPVTAYFVAAGGGWNLLDYGTGIDCTDTGIPAEACARL